MLKKTICNVKFPTNMNDAVNKDYVNNEVIPSDSNSWKCGYRKLTNMKVGSSNQETIDFQQFEGFNSWIL